MSHIKISKNNLREEVSKRISTLENREKKDLDICGNLANILNTYQVQNILAYLPLKDEPNIKSCVNYFKNKFNIYLASLDKFEFYPAFEDQFFEVDNIDFSIVDLILMPGRAFGRKGERLGRGGGWYDRMLARINPKVPRIGVCYTTQIYDSLPVEEHDRFVHYIVTEDQIFECSNANINK